mgnify:CR=1 FL=1
MAERLHSMRLFNAALVSGLASGVISSALDMRRDVIRLEAFLFMASSPTSRADLSFEFAVSPDNSTFGAFADNTAIFTSTVSLTGISAGWLAVPMPNTLAPFVRFIISGVGSNPVDTRITGDVVLRMN